MLGGFAGVRCYDVVTKETAVAGDARAVAWAELLRTLRAPRTAVLAHTRTSISGPRLFSCETHDAAHACSNLTR